MLEIGNIRDVIPIFSIEEDVNVIRVAMMMSLTKTGTKSEHLSQFWLPGVLR
jgi:hypothetical protein